MKKRYIYFLGILSAIAFNVRASGFSPVVELLLLEASEETSSTWASLIAGSGRTLDFDATNVKFGTKPALRGGFIYTPTGTDWTSSIYWNYFETKANTGFSIGEQIVIPEFFSGFLSGNFFFGARLHWKLKMNMMDAEIGHPFSIDETFSITPKIGVKGGTIHQAIKADWDAGLYTSTEKLKNNFSGIGPSFGMETKWNMLKSLTLFGDFSAAFLYGTWKIDDVYVRPAAFLVTPTTITTTLNKTKLGTMMYKFRAGFEWIYQGKLPLSVQLGYEMQFWPNQLRIPTFQQLPVHGGLTLQGATCQFRIDL